ncbi:ecto-ADP-ribosyltransferase 5-like [Pseudorasbora parva]|uniref:ecto-ADP-ribosyltransferase 5-like n=1 Tax=Pseudorasbora parva TaxID=51549 RepID=UPI00351E6E06
MKMLLIIEALLLISAALGQDHRVGDVGQIFPLDMAESSVDDLYVGCKNSMGDRVKTELLEKELNELRKFRIVWQDAENNAKIPNDNLTWNHSVAIYVYTNSGFDLYKDFNDAVRTNKHEYQNRNSKYTWYSLQFLLTEAIQILKETQNGCKSTYRGTNVEFNKNVLNSEVRFGSFASSSLNRTVAEEFGSTSCFEIRTCEGADVSGYSTFPNEEEVLIPPYEKFKVTDVKTRTDHEDLWCETVYVLESSGVRSDLNCALFKNPEELSKTSAFNNNALCRCFYQNINRATSHSGYQSRRFLRLRLRRCIRQHLQREDRVYLPEGEISSDIHLGSYPLRGHRVYFPEGETHLGLQNYNERFCSQVLHSLEISYETMFLLNHCCRG